MRVGGGVSHRFGLDDAVLIKDNHVAAAGGVAAAIRARARGRRAPGEDRGGGRHARAARRGARRAASTPCCSTTWTPRRSPRRCAARRPGAHRGLGRRAARERAPVAETGVDLVSIGWLTHSAQVLDIGLDWPRGMLRRKRKIGRLRALPSPPVALAVPDSGENGVGDAIECVRGLAPHAGRDMSKIRRVTCLVGPTTPRAASATRKRKVTMIAVIFEVWPTDGRRPISTSPHRSGPCSRRSTASFRIERFQSLTDATKLLSLSFWRDETAVAAWRNVERHRAAQRRGREACSATIACASPRHARLRPGRPRRSVASSSSP